nr:tol-pal system protein YbgF [Pseudoruegeria sp. HB172150]
MKGSVLALALALAPVAKPVAAQDSATLADIRQELSVLYVELQRLKRELSTTGAPVASLGGSTAIERMDRIEEELRRMTAKTEEMQLRINSVVEDGTNRIGDLEFRLCELEADCDIGSLGDTPTLGGEVQGAAEMPSVTPLPETTLPAGAEMAMGEQADFDAARAVYDSGDYQQAAAQFQSFTETYPGGPLNAQAHYLRGEALTQLGQTADAGRAYLASFSGSPDGPNAPDALLKLASSLSQLGQVDEACVMLTQIGARFPSSPQAQTAVGQAQSLRCQ